MKDIVIYILSCRMFLDARAQDRASLLARHVAAIEKSLHSTKVKTKHSWLKFLYSTSGIMTINESTYWESGYRLSSKSHEKHREYVLDDIRRIDPTLADQVEYLAGSFGYRIPLKCD